MVIENELMVVAVVTQYDIRTYLVEIVSFVSFVGSQVIRDSPCIPPFVKLNK